MKKYFLFMTIAILFIEMTSVAQKTGSFTDSRDGKIYKTIKIGNQTWMAKNLAYKVTSGCWAYHGDQNNAKIYGYLYDWETAKKICPSGWHLPGDNEWQTLIDYLGGKNVAGGKLKSTGGWKSPNTGANNSSGFSALPGGYRSTYDGAFDFLGGLGYWWSSKQNDFTLSTYFYLYHDDTNAAMNTEVNTYGFSVRCVRNN